MKLYIGRDEFLKRIQVEGGELKLPEIQRKDISIQQVLYPVRPFAFATTESYVTNKIWAALNLPVIRKGDAANLDEVDVTRYKKLIERFVKAEEPVQMVFIGFPFKSHHNPLKTNRLLPDLGELYFLRRLLEIDATVKQIYAPGINWIILSEGEAYREIGHISGEEVCEYLKGVRKFVSLLGADDRIRFVNLADLFRRYPEFESRVGETKEALEKQFQSSPESLSTDFQTMLWTMRHSVDTRTFSAEELYHLTSDTYPESAPEEIRGKWQQVYDDAVRMTCWYASINQVKNVIGKDGSSIIQEAYPDACYVSITPKPGRYAFHALSSNSRFLPHHGVPILVGKRNGYVRVAYLVDILSKPHQYRAVYVTEDSEGKPFFYHQIENNHKAQVTGAWGGY